LDRTIGRLAEVLTDHVQKLVGFIVVTPDRIRVRQ
jgi:hypothetical protein